MHYRMKPTNKSQYLRLSLIFILIILVWSQERTRKFIGHHDWDNIYWETAAENYQHYGLISTRFQPIVNAYQSTPEEWDVNQHHPPGIPLLTYLGIGLFGNSEFAARLVPLLTSLLAAALIFQTAKQLYGNKVALLSLVFFGFTPLMIYFSAKIGHEQFTLPLMLTVILIYKAWLKHPKKWHIPTLTLLVIVGGFVSWAWYLFWVLIGCHAFIYGKKARIRSLWPIFVGIISTIASLILLYIWQQPDSINTLRDAFLSRTTNNADEVITPLLWSMVVGSRLLWLPTPVVTFLAIIGIFKLIRGKPNENEILLVIPALVTILYCGVFWQATYKHDYLIYYLVAPFSIWAAVGFFKTLYAYSDRPKIAWRLILYSLLILYVLGSARWSLRLFNIDVVQERYDWAVLIGKSTTPDEIAVINLEDYGAPHLSYYAKRRVRFEVTPTEVTSPSSPENWGFYVFCEDKDTVPPRWLMAYQYQFDKLNDNVGCYLIDLKP